MRCFVCNDDIPTEGRNLRVDLEVMDDHFRLLHPANDLERWPDGGPVVIDTTLEPSDFEVAP